MSHTTNDHNDETTLYTAATAATLNTGSLIEMFIKTGFSLNITLLCHWHGGVKTRYEKYLYSDQRDLGCNVMMTLYQGGPALYNESGL